MILDDTVPTPGATPGPQREESGNLAGQRFGAYEILEEIARGGQGAVLRARHSELGTIVALKILLSPQPKAVRRFQEEAQILARLRHPNLPAVTDLGTVSGRPYLAMEFVSGKDLKSHVREGGLPSPEWIVEVLRSVALTLQYCHEQGIVHRDLKPANILIEEAEGRPVLVDFGLVKRDRGQFQLPTPGESASQPVIAAPSKTADATGDLTQDGEVMGTPAYMAPEQADPAYGEVGPRTDVYALGATLHFLLSGRPPYEAKTVYTIIAKLLKSTAPPDPTKHDPNVHPALAALCRRTLSKSPDERPPTATAFADALTKALHARRRAARRALTSVGLVFIGLAIGVAAALTQAQQPEPWAAALLHLRAGSALSAEAVADLEADANADWRRWKPLALVESALISGRSVPPQLLNSLPAGPEGDLLRFEARLGDLDESKGAAEAAADCVRFLEGGDQAALPWRSESPTQRWARLAKGLEARGFKELAAKAWVWTAHYAHTDGDEAAANAWVHSAFALDPLEAAVNGEPVAEFLLAAAESTLRQAIQAAERVDATSADDVARIEREVIKARYQLDRYRMIRPKAHIPAEVLSDLRSLGRSSMRGLRIAAMSGNRVWKPAERSEFEAVLDRPLKPEELKTLRAGNPRTWPPDWDHMERRASTLPYFRRLEIMEEWLLWRPDQPGLWTQVAFLKMQVSRHRASEHAWRIAVANEHVEPGPLEFRLGVVLFEQRDYREALVHYQRAIETHKTLYSVHGLAKTLNVLGRPAEAIAALDTIMEQGKGNAHYWMTRADAYTALGDTTQAETCRATAFPLR